MEERNNVVRDLPFGKRNKLAMPEMIEVPSRREVFEARIAKLRELDDIITELKIGESSKKEF